MNRCTPLKKDFLSSFGGLPQILIQIQIPENNENKIISVGSRMWKMNKTIPECNMFRTSPAFPSS